MPIFRYIDCKCCVSEERAKNHEDGFLWEQELKGEKGLGSICSVWSTASSAM